MDDKKTLDEVLVSIFKGLTSYTWKYDRDILPRFHVYSTTDYTAAAAYWMPHGWSGEFTRAFLNGKLDLSQAEAVADLISSDNAASHQIAMQQMRGGFLR
jgi:tRNA modification GTPase